MKMSWALFILFIIAVFLICIFVFYPKALKAPSFERGEVCIKEKCFQVELAETSAQREAGLMYRKELFPDAGMFFVFDKEGKHSFWMKNTLIPLDIIWIDSEGRVVYIKENAPPCKALICPSFVSPLPAKYILEINAGLCAKIGIKAGDQIKKSP
jgi:uncharacterized membrane protein (UPF0127 family)